jgi:polar amino acid transport system permease protein
MFDYCADPKTLEGLAWLSCYLTTAKHFSFYLSFLTVIVVIVITAPLVLVIGFAGALAQRSTIGPVRWLGWAYAAVVRGVPDIVFFLFVPIAVDQALEYIRHRTLCSDQTGSVWVGNDFVVCQQAKLPLTSAETWVHDLYGLALAVLAFAMIYGAYAANVIQGAMRAVPSGQLEAGRAIGMSAGQIFRRIHVPQMWVYALPGLSNLWMILLKATPFLFLLGIQDPVYWARELGGFKTQVYAYSHEDWRFWYFSALMLFYLGLTWVSQIGFDRLSVRVSRGMALAR